MLRSKWNYSSICFRSRTKCFRSRTKCFRSRTKCFWSRTKCFWSRTKCFRSRSNLSRSSLIYSQSRSTCYRLKLLHHQPYSLCSQRSIQPRKINSRSYIQRFCRKLKAVIASAKLCIGKCANLFSCYVEYI